MVFKIKVDELTLLFEPDNIRHGDSIGQLKKWGGVDSLESHLATNFRKGIVKDSKDHDKRVESYGDNKPIIKPPKTIT